MRINTTVSALDADGRQQPFSHSLTLYHAGKVYDYIDDVGEVVILEPVEHRFIILGANSTATEVSFTQLLQFLERANGVAEQYVQELLTQNDDNSIRTIAAVRFQLNPAFDMQSKGNQLTLSGQHIAYEVEATTIDSSDLTQQFLDYADWTARLNYVLHPHTLHPASRVKLNQALRDRGQLPLKVTLTRNLDGTSRLQARHQYEWTLKPVDRQIINQWERTLTSDKVKWVSFHEYQEKLLMKVKKD